MSILVASFLPDLHDAEVDRGVDTGPAVARPVAQRVGAVLLDERHRRDDVALRLRHLLAIGVEHPAVDRGVGPRQRAVLEPRPHDRVEEPRADDLRALRPEIHRERALEEVGIVDPAGGDLRRERRRGPRVHDVGIGGEAAGLVALRLGEAGRAVGRGIDGQRVLGRQQRIVVIGRVAVGADAVPDRERHAEVALATDQPVGVQPVEPRVVAHAHVRRVPAAARLPSASSSARRSRSRPPLRRYHCRDVTISSGRSPFSKNFTGCVIGTRLAVELARGLQLLDDDLLRLLHVATRDRAVGGRAVGREPLGRIRLEPAVDARGPRGSGAAARATTRRRWCRRTCRSSRCRFPSRDRRGGARRSARARRTAA